MKTLLADWPWAQDTRVLRQPLGMLRHFAAIFLLFEGVLG